MKQQIIQVVVEWQAQRASGIDMLYKVSGSVATLSPQHRVFSSTTVILCPFPSIGALHPPPLPHAFLYIYIAQMEAAKKYGGHMGCNFVVPQFSVLSRGKSYIDWLVVILDNEVLKHYPMYTKLSTIC